MINRADDYNIEYDENRCGLFSEIVLDAQEMWKSLEYRAEIFCHAVLSCFPGRLRKYGCNDSH